MIRTSTGTVAVIFAAAVALAPAARAADWVKDSQTGCATTNPFPNPNESVRWFGGCAGGKLDGRGTLIWYRDGVETERNEGSFRGGEMDGYAVTRYPDGNVVHGQYKQGQRHGSFMTIRAGGEHVRAAYFEGRMIDQKRLTAAEAAEWQRNGGPQLVANAPPPSPEAQTAAAAPGGGEEPATGRTAVASPSRMLPPPPKPAEAPGKPIVAKAAPAPKAAPPAAPRRRSLPATSPSARRWRAPSARPCSPRRRR